MKDGTTGKRSKHKRLLVECIVVAALCLWGWATMIRMPGTRYHGPLAELTEEESALARRHLRAHRARR